MVKRSQPIGPGKPDLRFPLTALACLLIGAGLLLQPTPATALAGSGSALLAVILMVERHRPILQAARRLVHVFAFTDESCKVELQELARAVFTGRGK